MPFVPVCGTWPDSTHVIATTMNETNPCHRGQWRITERSLKALAGTPEWQEFARSWQAHGSPDSPITPEWVYGADGKLSHLWFTAWDSPETMRSDVSCNHGGGVPMSVINALVELSGPVGAQGG